MSRRDDEKTADAVGEERARIAREMHDGMAQTLAYVLTKAQAALTLMRRHESSRAEQQLAQLVEAAREAYGDAREAILALRTQPADGVPVGEVLERYVAAWSEKSGIATKLESDLGGDTVSEPRLPPRLELQLVRIVQEALTNVRKHANGRSVRVELIRANGKLTGSIEDDGNGFDPDRLGRSSEPRFGLAVMRERAEAAGGRLCVDSAPGRGTRVSFELPIGEE